MAQDLTDRQRRILARLVTEYIEQGEPVSSAWLAEHSDARPVVGDGAQHPGAARGTGPRPPAAHVGRPRADRFRLPPVRRRPARIAQAPRRLPETRSAAAPRRHGRRPARERVAGTVARLASDRLRAGAGQPVGAAAAHRLREPRRPARARHRRRDRRPDHAQGDRAAGAVRRPAADAGGQLHQRASSPA